MQDSMPYSFAPGHAGGEAAYGTKTDIELIACCQERDTRAFKHLMRRYESRVNYWLSRVMPQWQDRSDLQQEVMTKVWFSIRSLRRSEAFGRWLHQLVNNLAYDNMRDLSRMPLLSIDAPVATDGEERPLSREIADLSRIPENICERKELAWALRKAIDKLPEEFRTVVVMREINGLAYAEIARRTKCRVGTVKSRISRARQKIRHFLMQYL
jgi:RNA polymerase sigma-70 factor (ECF subfamily)